MSGGDTGWGERLRAGLALGLSPEAFWTLSLREWRGLVRSHTKTASRTDLDALIARFPDRQSKKKTDDGNTL